MKIDRSLINRLLDFLATPAFCLFKHKLKLDPVGLDLESGPWPTMDCAGFCTRCGAIAQTTLEAMETHHYPGEFKADVTFKIVRVFYEKI